MTEPSKRPILIAGPTASGKSTLALALAERCDGIVINADSMQVYRELSVLTARPSAEDERRAPHALYGHVPAKDAYSVARWLEDVRGVLEDARLRALRPIIVGGTGLYFKVLLEGLSPIPPIPIEIRRHWRDRAQEQGAVALHAELAVKDPAMASRLKPTDLQRVTRALEVLDATGESLSAWQRLPGKGLLAHGRCVCVQVTLDRAELYARCDMRFDAMMAQGARDEVRRLMALELDGGLPAMRALGIAPLAAALQGKLALPIAVARAKTETRQYAKRQLTWIKRNMSAWNDIDAKEKVSNMVDRIMFIDS